MQYVHNQTQPYPTLTGTRTAFRILGEYFDELWPEDTPSPADYAEYLYHATGLHASPPYVQALFASLN